MVIFIAQLHSTKSELKFCAGQILLMACWRFMMVTISDNGPGWKYGLKPFVGQPYYKTIHYQYQILINMLVLAILWLQLSDAIGFQLKHFKNYSCVTTQFKCLNIDKAYKITKLVQDSYFELSAWNILCILVTFRFYNSQNSCTQILFVIYKTWTYCPRKQNKISRSLNMKMSQYNRQKIHILKQILKFTISSIISFTSISSKMELFLYFTEGEKKGKINSSSCKTF